MKITEIKTVALTDKVLHEMAIAALRTDKYEDGTYNVSTLESVEFDHGYQVTFCQVGDNYSDDDYEFLVAMFREASEDGEVYAGKFGGEPEISFLFGNKADAVKYAKMFNQISIWDWKAMDEIKTGGTGKR